MTVEKAVQDVDSHINAAVEHVEAGRVPALSWFSELKAKWDALLAEVKTDVETVDEDLEHLVDKDETTPVVTPTGSVETKVYTDGSTATGPGALPNQSPAQQEAAKAPEQEVDAPSSPEAP